MRIPQHVLDFIRLGHPQQICTHVTETGDKTMQFDGSQYVISGYKEDTYFEYEFSSLEPAIACYQAIKV